MIIFCKNAQRQTWTNIYRIHLLIYLRVFRSRRGKINSYIHRRIRNYRYNNMQSLFFIISIRPRRWFNIPKMLSTSALIFCIGKYSHGFSDVYNNIVERNNNFKCIQRDFKKGVLRAVDVSNGKGSRWINWIWRKWKITSWKWFWSERNFK